MNFSERNICKPPVVLTPDLLSQEQRDLADSYIKMALKHGVLVGAILGKDDADIRPLVLDNGIMKLIRFSDVKGKLDSRWSLSINDVLQRLSVYQEVDLISFGIDGDVFWQVRPYYQKSLGEVTNLQKNTIGVSPRELAYSLYKTINFLNHSGIIHGHLSFSNLSIEDYSLKIMDFAFVSSQHKNFYSYEIAPEVVNGDQITLATDVYNLGIIFKELFGNFFNDEQNEFVSAMLSSHPHSRPTIDKVGDVFFYDYISESQGEADNDTYKNQMDNQDLKLGKIFTSETFVCQTEVLDVPVEENSFDNDHDVDTNSTIKKEISNHQSVNDVRTKVKSKKSLKIDHTTSILLVILIFLVSVLVLKKYYFDFGTNDKEEDVVLEQYSDSQYLEFWETNIPSIMTKTATAAASGISGAQIVIIKDLINGNVRPNVNNELLKIAFDPQWESRLSEQDRKVAFQLGLSQLVPYKLKMPNLGSLHPGVLYAVLVSLDLNIDIKELNTISVQKFYSLPVQLATAFKLLGNNLSLGDTIVRSLAKILAGQRTPDLLVPFFNEIPNQNVLLQRLQIVTGFSSDTPTQFSDKDIYNAMSIGKGVARERIDWLNVKTAASWDKKPIPLKLVLVLGTMPKDELSIEGYADLLRFPSSEVPLSAAAKLLSKYLSKENKETVAFFVDKNNIIDRQTVIAFVSILGMESKLRYAMFEQWFETSPNNEQVIKLLISRKDIKDDSFSIAAIRYLKDKNLPFSNESLKELISHKEPLARVLVYSKLNPADPIHMKLITEAYKNETVDRLKIQLREKAADIGVKLK